MLEKKYHKSRPSCKVTFTAPARLDGETVTLVGEFNQWNETELPMKRQKDSSFRATIDLESSREYQFRYLVNGTEWHNDEAADKYIPNGFGEENSVVVV